jgi:hypothetical protein
VLLPDLPDDAHLSESNRGPGRSFGLKVTGSAADVGEVGFAARAKLSACLGLAALACLLIWPAPSEAKAKPLPPLAPTEDDALTHALERGELTEAEYALERARSLFRLGAVRSEFGDVERVDSREATLVLRDLAVRLRALSATERTEGRTLLARPGGGGVDASSTVPADVAPMCDENVCVHWASGERDSAWQAATFEIFREVWQKQVVELRYRKPLPDTDSDDNGVGDQLDIYIGDLGPNLFGYCATDDPARSDYSVYAVSAYCVVDDDYNAAQYGTAHSPEDFLRVTAAHEFHHAVQYAYDWLEDEWLMEGTATNIEETVYPEIDDNVAFLEASQLRAPHVPLDRGGLGDYEYGSWIFWRYLEEKVAGNPDILREVWEWADASAPFSPDHYSLSAVTKELGDRKRSFATEYARFGVANRLRDYADGALYPRTPTSKSFSLGTGRRVIAWQQSSLDHLATRFFAFYPGPAATGKGELRVDVDLTYGGRATVISVYASGRVVKRRLTLGPGAAGSVRVPFGRGVIRRVDLLLSNASTRTECWEVDWDDKAPLYSCLGRPTDDRRVYRFRATHIR